MVVALAVVALFSGCQKYDDSELKKEIQELSEKLCRSSRPGERSRGVLDSGSASCCLLLNTMADAAKELLVA